jgi:PAS domain S-box-containing protein
MANDASAGAPDLDYRVLLETAADAIVVVDQGGIIRYANAQAERMFGHARADLLGSPIELLVPARIRGAHGAMRASYVERPTVRPMGSGRDLFGVDRDGREIPVEISLSPLPTLDGLLVSAVIRDITDRKRRDEELRQAKADADAANAAKSEFLSSMSHELRTPLNAILGFTQLLQRDRKAPLNDRQQGMLEHVVRGGEHLLRLIDEILDLSKIESGNVAMSPEPFALADVLREIETTLAPLAERAGVALRVEPPPPGFPALFADRTRVAQILLNYGSNAIKYGRPGGHARIAATLDGGSARLAVGDDGIGIPLEQQVRVFQPFHRAGQETGPIEGTGIGLTITKRLAEMMGGTVGFTSTPGKGSEFWVWLPTHLEAVAPLAAPAPVVLGEHATGRRTVLYVEDNPANLAFMASLFEHLEGAVLLSAPTAELGLELALAHRPDLIILDINLPGMNGYEALQRLREATETRRIPVFALSAAATERDVRNGLEAGFDRYLTKPVKVDELTAALLEVLGQPA